MLTKYYRAIYSYTQSHYLDPSSSWPAVQFGDVVVYSVGKTTASLPGGYYTNPAIRFVYGSSMNPWLHRSSLFARIGTGTTPPTLSDTKPEVDITPDFINYEVLCSTSSENNSVTTTITVTGHNNSNNDYTITELVIYQICEMNTGIWVAGSLPIIRDLLIDPITVKAYTGFSLTYNWVDD